MTPDVFSFAATELSWIPPFSQTGFLLLAAACAAVWLATRLFGGRSRVGRRRGLLGLRALSLAVLAVILFGPTEVDREGGEVTRPDMIYLLDGSQSMQLGGPSTRWQESLDFVRTAQRQAGPQETQQVHAFRFGHRLQPLTADAATAGAATADSRAGEGQSNKLRPVSRRQPDVGSQAWWQADRLPEADASDSRLADALRQLLPQVRGSSTAGVVLLSDGRVRASESVEQLASLMGRSRVPLHVVPVGASTGTGDVAVLSLVVPPQVRKFTENELQVYLRSFGYDNQRTTVRVLSGGVDGEGELIASLPITLTGGGQSASLTFRVEEEPRDLQVVIDPLEGELSSANNRVRTRVDIDRTKIRVLSIHDARELAETPSLVDSLLTLAGRAPVGGARQTPTLRAALEADEDLECTILVSSGGGEPQALASNTKYAASIGFPQTRAELFAYDCLLLNGVGAEVLSEQQAQWLRQWIEGRGGGLVVTGGAALRPQAWQDSPLEPLLPVAVDQAVFSPPQARTVVATQPQHPVWRLQREQDRNATLLRELPQWTIGVDSLPVKASAEVLASVDGGELAALVAARVGRGRVLVSPADLTGRALERMAGGWGPQGQDAAAKFWRNLLYWATEGSSTGRRRLVAGTDKRFYRPGQPLNVAAVAYDEAAVRTGKYRVWAMLEPESLDDMSLYSPVLWPDGLVRDSGETGPRIAWGEELPLTLDTQAGEYRLNLMLSESGGGDGGFRIEMTAYEGAETASSFDHGTQVDSTSLGVQVLSDPFEQQNPLPNHELLWRLADLSGGRVLRTPDDLAGLLAERPRREAEATWKMTPAWSRWWLYLLLAGLLCGEWFWRRMSGLA